MSQGEYNLARMFKQLHAAGLLSDVLDEKGQTVPSEAAVNHIEAQYGDDPPADKRRLAQAQTLIDLAKKHNLEMN